MKNRARLKKQNLFPVTFLKRSNDLYQCIVLNDEVMALHYKINTQVKQKRASVNFTKLKSQSSLILCRGC